MAEFFHMLLNYVTKVNALESWIIPILAQEKFQILDEADKQLGFIVAKLWLATPKLLERLNYSLLFSSVDQLPQNNLTNSSD